MIYETDFITDFIFVEHDIKPCEAILVPGGTHPQLAENAAKLYHAGLGRFVVFSDASECKWFESLMIRLGVPKEAILSETRATNTFENAEFTLALLRKAGIPHERVILACKAYHSRRALLTYQHVFPKCTEFFVATTRDKRGLDKDNWTTKSEYINIVMGEVVKIGKYFADKIYCEERCDS